MEHVVRILTIDGGGIRGIIPAPVLQEREPEEAARLAAAEERVPAQAVAVLRPEEIRRGEELANWAVFMALVAGVWALDEVQRPSVPAAGMVLAAPHDPVAALEPGSGQSARDPLADGQPCPFCPEMVVAPGPGAFAAARADPILATEQSRE
jgi:hypothetical protein